MPGILLSSSAVPPPPPPMLQQQRRNAHMRPFSLPCGHTKWQPSFMNLSCKNCCTAGTCATSISDDEDEGCGENDGRDLVAARHVTISCASATSNNNNESNAKKSDSCENEESVDMSSVQKEQVPCCWSCDECGWKSAHMGDAFRPAGVNVLLEKLTHEYAARVNLELAKKAHDDDESSNSESEESDDDDRSVFVKSRKSSKVCTELPTCAVCCESLYEPVTLPCGHNFDRRCLQSALLRSNCCPLCRLELPADLPLKENVALTRLLEKINFDEVQFRRMESQGDDELRGAAARGDADTIRFLVKSGKVDDGAVSEALIASTAACHLAEVETLIKAGIVHESALTSSLILAVKKECNGIISLVASGANVDAEESGESVLMTSSRLGNAEACKTLLRLGASMEKTGMGGASPLIISAEGGHDKVVAVLLEHHAQVDFEDDSGMTALIAAASGGHEKILDMLITAGAQVDFQDEDGLTALMAAAEEGHVGCMQKLINARALIDAVSECDETALMSASRLGKVEAVRLLIESGAAVDLARPDGATALFCAALAGQTETVQILMNEGKATVETPLENGVTPLIASVFTQHEDCVDVLIGSGYVDVDRADHGCATPLSYAAMLGNERILKRLLDAGAAVECRMKRGETPLIIAAENGRMSCVKCLLDAGADKKAVNEDGFTALHMATVHLAAEKDLACISDLLSVQ